MNAMRYRYLDEPTYTHEQLIALKAEMHTKYHAVFDLATRCGLRLFEAASLERDENTGHYYFMRGSDQIVVSVPSDLRCEIERRKSDTLIITHDHNCHFESHYELYAGRSFAMSFSVVSKKLFGYSLGTNALRVAYCQKRFNELSRVQSPQAVINRLKLKMGSLSK